MPATAKKPAAAAAVAAIAAKKNGKKPSAPAPIVKPAKKNAKEALKKVEKKGAKVTATTASLFSNLKEHEKFEKLGIHAYKTTDKDPQTGEVIGWATIEVQDAEFVKLQFEDVPLAEQIARNLYAFVMDRANTIAERRVADALADAEDTKPAAKKPSKKNGKK